LDQGAGLSKNFYGKSIKSGRIADSRFHPEINKKAGRQRPFLEFLTILALRLTLSTRNSKRPAFGFHYSDSSSLKGSVTTPTDPFPTLTAPLVTIFVVLAVPLTVHLTGVVTTLVAMHPKLNKRKKRKMENGLMHFMSSISFFPPIMHSNL